ncbi:MAG: sugar phosphate nucleotidyltransferase [Xenococcaceae cyanobacterium MO_188.B19]|nr:sugar phosphate nucleotidyltransferase [Xenococcaceae cyanobacterium MO_188.B19]
MIKIFVPGRLCLFGEHSDWAGTYRRLNPKIVKGYALIVGTNQGIYARVKQHPQNLIFQASFSDGSKSELVTLPMTPEGLLEEAQKGGFFSYIAGTAYQILTNYEVKGLEIDNYLTDLPIQKGLSSSAAICVLIARAFNQIYNLQLTIREEMEIAYLGERITPSLCGRMDQAGAFGNKPILMTFDGEQVELEELSVKQELYLVIVDLGGSKDTPKILRDLNSCYPFPKNQIQQNVQQYLGILNAQFLEKAVALVKEGDAQSLGTLMSQVQVEFDRHLIPACPDQLTAPKLHLLLNHPELQPFIYGGKGVGSQGDGTAQLVARNRESQDQAISIIHRNFPQMQALKLTISPPAKVKKAVIPAAGFGTRMFPATKVIKKELLPIVDRDGRAKPIILKIVEEAIMAGIEEVAIVVQQGDVEIFQEFFQAPPKAELLNKLSPENREYSQYLEDLGQRITFLVQESQEGFGHAVFCAKNWVKDQPFLLLLGDHIYQTQTALSCTEQLLAAFAQSDRSVIGLTIMSEAIIHKAGCVTGVWQKPNSLLEITKLYEKPTLEYAQANLHVPGMAESDFLGVFGLYVLKPEIFEHLEAEIQNNCRYKGEFQLTTCLDRLREKAGIMGYLVEGEYFDVGMPQFYRQTIHDF